MSKDTSIEILMHAAKRAKEWPFFIARDLAQYQSYHGIGEEELAHDLGCQRESLARLALCRRPDTTASAFRDLVERISAYTGADSIKLARLLREVESTSAMQDAPPQMDTAQHPGLLVAARDQIEEPASEDECEGESGAEEQDEPEQDGK